MKIEFRVLFFLIIFQLLLPNLHAQEDKILALKAAALLKSSFQEAQIVYLNYSKSLNELGMNEILQPELLKTRSQIFEAQKKTLKVFEAISSYRKNCIQLFDAIEEKVCKLGNTEKQKVVLRLAFLGKRSEGLKKIFDFIINQEEIGAACIEILQFLEENNSSYTVGKDGKFHFDTVTLEKQFGLLARNFFHLADKERLLMEANSSSVNDFEKVIDGLEKTSK